MTEEELPEDRNRKRIKQTISVPFLWEEKPGTPKREWRLSKLPVNRVMPTPIKQIASVPFQWEEKLGTPLPSFSHPPPNSAITLHPTGIIATMSPPGYLRQDHNHEDDNLDGDDEQKDMSETDYDSLDFETDEFFNSAPSLLANRLIPTSAISNAIPVHETSWMETNSGYLQAPSSPAWETDSSTSSYATGTTSLVGESFLQCMFPLLTPNSGFLSTVGCSEKGVSHFTQKAPSKELDIESMCSSVATKPITLGQLIMTSRRRSYQRKVVRIRDDNISMEFMKRTVFGCCIRIGGLQDKWKSQLRLKQI